MEINTGQLKIKLLVVILCLTAVPAIITAQGKHERQHPIPENIDKIFQVSCMPCHGIKGGRFPRARLNFARWAEYGASKETEKALLICSAIRKGVMPPKSVRESKPELVPAKEQMEMICQWAQTLKEGKKQKSGSKGTL